jgi:hypothetical protein
VDGALIGGCFGISRCHAEVVEAIQQGAPSMNKVSTDLSCVATVGLDLAKHIFFVHAVDAEGRPVVAKDCGAAMSQPMSLKQLR